MIKKNKKYHFYIVSHGEISNPFWQSFRKGVKDAARHFGVKATYLGSQKYSIAILVKNLKKVISRKPDGIAVTITDAQRLKRPLKKAIKQGIPIIVINVRYFKRGKIPYGFYVGMDDYLCGERLATRMLKKFTPQRAVVTIHQKHHQGLKQRFQGIKDILATKNVRTGKVDISTDRKEAIRTFRNHLKKHPDIDAIFTLDQRVGEAAIEFLEDKKLAGKIRLATVDFSPRTIAALKKGKIVCIADQGPYLQGFLPIQLFVQYHNNKNFNSLHKDILLGPTIADKSNIRRLEMTDKKLEGIPKRHLK